MNWEETNPLIVCVALVVAIIEMLANGFMVAAIAGDKMVRGNSMYLLWPTSYVQREK